MSQPTRRWRAIFPPASATLRSPKPAIAACRSAGGWRWRKWRRKPAKRLCKRRTQQLRSSWPGVTPQSITFPKTLLRRRWMRGSSPRMTAFTSRRGGGFGDGRVDPRHDLFGHQLHGALVQCRLDPVHAGVDELAEVADFFAEREDLVDNIVDAAVDHAVIHDIVEGDLFVRLFLVRLEHIEPLAALHLGAHLLVIEPVRAVGVVAAVACRRLVVIEHADRARDTPVRDVCFRARFGLALAVILPVRLEVLAEEKVGRQRMEVALAHLHHAGENGATTVPTISGRGFW